MRLVATAPARGGVPRTLEGIVLPVALDAARFDVRAALAFTWGELTVTVVPPRSALERCERRPPSLGELLTQVGSWLLVYSGPLGDSRAREMELTAGRRRGEVQARLLRSSGRPYAEGTIRIDQRGEIAFRVSMPGATSTRSIVGRLPVTRWRPGARLDIRLPGNPRARSSTAAARGRRRTSARATGR
jgi:hypothetical protein